MRMVDLCFALQLSFRLEELAIIVEMSVRLVSGVFEELATYVLVPLNRRVFMFFLFFLVL